MTERALTRPAVHIVGANPSMDRTQFVRGLTVGAVNRTVHAEPMAGGKGLIVARAMARLGTMTTVYGFVGGVVGRYIREECARLGLDDRHTEVEGDTRINAIIVDELSGDATVVNEQGPEVSRDEADVLAATLRGRVAQGDIVALSGSLPRGLDDSFAALLVRELRERGVRVVVDTSDDVLRATTAALPWAVKCNLEEFRGLRPDSPVAVHDDADRWRLIAQMRALVGQGIEIVAVTLGAEGALAVSATDVVCVRPPRIEVVNATGSGDTFLAGLLHAVVHEQSLPDAVRFAVAASAGNALLPLPDLGADPDLTRLLADTEIEVHEAGHAS